MRRLGTELGVEAMALYRYAAGKEDLLDGQVEALYLELEERLTAESGKAGPPTANTSRPSPAWRAELHRIARETYLVALRHPHAVPLLATRMLAVPLARRPVAVLRDHERVLGLLQQAGLDVAATARAHRAYGAWLLGYVFVELRAMVDAPDESDPAFRRACTGCRPRNPPAPPAAADLAERRGRRVSPRAWTPCSTAAFRTARTSPPPTDPCPGPRPGSGRPGGARRPPHLALDPPAPHLAAPPDLLRALARHGQECTV